MDIKYFGHSSFLLRGQKAKLITDPFDPKMVGIPFPKSEADIITVSHDHKDHNSLDRIDGSPLVITLPGEYEKNGVRITGYQTYHDEVEGAKRGVNIIYKIEIDDLTILHLGDLGHILTDELIEEIDVVDILLLPVGGIYTIGPEQAYKVMSQIEPSIVIPMHYRSPQLKGESFNQLSTLEDFLKISNTTPAAEPLKKLTLKKSDLTDDTKIVVMEIS